MKSSRKHFHMRMRRSDRFDKLWYVPPSEKSSRNGSPLVLTLTDDIRNGGDEEGRFMIMKILPKSIFATASSPLSSEDDNDDMRKDRRISKLARKSSVVFFCCLLVISSMENVAFSVPDERILSPYHDSDGDGDNDGVVGDDPYVIKYGHPFVSDTRALDVPYNILDPVHSSAATSTTTNTKIEIGKISRQKSSSDNQNMEIFINEQTDELSSTPPVRDEQRKLRMNHHHREHQHEHHHPYQLSSVPSSGLRPSPGSPMPNQNIRLDDITKKYQPSSNLLSRIRTHPHKIADLDCTLYGGPFEKMNVYWKNVENDKSYLPPFFHKEDIGGSSAMMQMQMNMMAVSDNQEIDQSAATHTSYKDSQTTKYLTFEPMLGGLDRNRMAFELYLVLASAMGRTLVLPPRQKYLYMAQGKEQEQILSMDDFFHLEELNREITGVNIITTEEFLLREGISGHLTTNHNEGPVYPPHNQTNWDAGTNSNLHDVLEMYKYIHSIAHVASSWNNNCMVAFPSDVNNDGDYSSGNARLSQLFQHIQRQADGRPLPDPIDYQGRPLSYDAPVLERMREMMAGRSKLCLYDDDMQDATVVHIPSSMVHERQGGKQLMLQYYSFAFFEDPQQNLWSHRLIRDHLRYRDVIQCAASRAVQAVRDISLKYGEKGVFHSLSMAKDTYMPNQEYLTQKQEAELVDALSNDNHKLEPGSVLFVITNPGLNLDYLQTLLSNYYVVTISDFRPTLLTDINPNYDGAISQLIAARSHTFYGSYESSHCGYIARLRGYYSTRDRWSGYAEGRLGRTYTLGGEGHRNEYGIYKSIQRPFFAREFPISWMSIDADVN